MPHEPAEVLRILWTVRGRSFTGAHLISALELSRGWGAPQSAGNTWPYCQGLQRGRRRLCSLPKGAQLLMHILGARLGQDFGVRERAMETGAFERCSGTVRDLCGAGGSLGGGGLSLGAT